MTVTIAITRLFREPRGHIAGLQLIFSPKLTVGPIDRGDEARGKHLSVPVLLVSVPISFEHKHKKV